MRKENEYELNAPSDGVSFPAQIRISLSTPPREPQPASLLAQEIRRAPGDRLRYMELARAQSVMEHLATTICDSEPRITTKWMDAVERDARFQSTEHLAKEDLKGCLPPIFDSLVDMLRAPANPRHIERADEEARLHGHLRFKQGYRLDELLREEAKVRELVLSEALDFESQTPDFQGFVKRTALERINHFFDDLMCDSAGQFSSEQGTEAREDLSTVRTQRAEAQEQRRSAEAVNQRNLEAVDLTVARLREKFNQARMLYERLERDSASTDTLSGLRMNLVEMEHLVSALVD